MYASLLSGHGDRGTWLSPVVSVKVLMDKKHRDGRQRDRLIDRHTQLNTKYDLGMISYIPLGKSSFWINDTVFPAGKGWWETDSEGKLKLISRPLAMTCKGRLCFQAWSLDLPHGTLYLLFYCQVRPTALKNHPIITCDKSSSYLEDQAVNTQGRQMAPSRWMMHVREQRTEQTLLFPAHGCPPAWVTRQKVNLLHKTTRKWSCAVQMLVIMTKPPEMGNQSNFM